MKPRNEGAAGWRSLERRGKMNPLVHSFLPLRGDEEDGIGQQVDLIGSEDPIGRGGFDNEYSGESGFFGLI